MSKTAADLNERPQLTGRGASRSGLICLFIALAIAYFLQIGHGLPNQDVTWGADGDPMVPLVFAKKVILDGWNTGWHTPYPDFHRFVLLLFQGPYMVFQKVAGNLDGLDMGAGYPYGVQDFDTIYMHLAFITRSVSCVMAMGAVFFVMKTSRALFPDASPVFSGIILGFAPSIVYYVHTETLDVPMLFWLSAGVYCYVRAIQTFELRYYLWLAVFAAVSTATKDYAYGAYVLMPLPLVVALAKRAYGLNIGGIMKSVADKRHLYALGMFVLAFILAENIIWNPSGFVNHVKLALGIGNPEVTIETNFNKEIVFSLGRVYQLARIMPFCLGWISIPVCLMGMGLVALRSRRECWVILIPLISYYVFTIYIPGSGLSAKERSHMPLCFFLAVFGGQMLASIWIGRELTWLRKGCVATVATLIALNGYAVDCLFMFDTRYQTEQWFADNVDHGAFIESYGYRTQCPRLYDNWVNVIVNQDEAPKESDLQITSTEHFEKLDDRNPKYILVPQSFMRSWMENKKHQESPLRDSIVDFFSDLEAGTIGYKKREHFYPLLGPLFGMPENRRHIPEIMVYERVKKS